MSHAIYQIARADFRERIRRYSFMITLAATVVGAYLFLPPNDGTYVNIQMNGHRGIYNSAMVGNITALMSSVFLFMAGFFLVRNTIHRDRATGVGQIIAATPVRKLSYTLGKALSNFAVLVTMMGVLILAAIVMQLIRGEEYAIHPWKLLEPFLLVALPTAALVAAAAILSETIRVLSGIIGGVAWFALWINGLTSDGFGKWDLYGITRTLTSLKSASVTAFPNDGPNVSRSIGFNFHDDGSLWHLTTFPWNGVPLTSHFALQRIELIGVAIVLAASGAIFFDRFKRIEVAGRERLTTRLLRRFERLSQRRWLGGTAGDATKDTASALTTGLTRTEVGRSEWFGLFQAEWRLLLYHHGAVWQLAAVGLMIASAFSPLDVVRNILWPIAWFWPVLAWSALGNRETQNNTDQIVFSTPRPIVRQLLMSWSAGTAFAMVIAAPVALRLLLAGEWGAILAWAVGAALIPALAVALGVWTGSGRLFEVLFMLLMYLCAVEHIPMFDFMGISSAGIVTGRSAAYLLFTVVLLLLAVLGRQRQLQH